MLPDHLGINIHIAQQIVHIITTNDVGDHGLTFGIQTHIGTVGIPEERLCKSPRIS